MGFKLRFPWGSGDAKVKSVGGTQSLSLVGGNFKAKQKYAEFSLAKSMCKNTSDFLIQFCKYKQWLCIIKRAIQF